MGTRVGCTRTSSKAVLRFDVRHSPSLPDPVRRRLVALVAAVLRAFLQMGHPALLTLAVAAVVAALLRAIKLPARAVMVVLAL